MCGTLKFEGKARKIGEPVSYTDIHDNRHLSGKWTGLARTESLGWWVEEGGAHPVLIHANAFVEGKAKLEIHVPGKILLGIRLSRSVTLQGKVVGRPGEVKIVTRAAETPFEKGVHGRWPVALLKGHGTQKFTKQHVIAPRGGKDPRQMSLLREKHSG